MSATTESQEKPVHVPRRRFVGRKNVGAKAPTTSIEPATITDTGDLLVKKEGGDNAKSSRPARRYVNQIPPEILNDEELNIAISILPSNYNFEIHKSVWHIRKQNAKKGMIKMIFSSIAFLTNI